MEWYGCLYAHNVSEVVSLGHVIAFPRSSWLRQQQTRSCPSTPFHKCQGVDHARSPHAKHKAHRPNSEVCFRLEDWSRSHGSNMKPHPKPHPKHRISCKPDRSTSSDRPPTRSGDAPSHAFTAKGGRGDRCEARNDQEVVTGDQALRGNTRGPRRPRSSIDRSVSFSSSFFIISSRTPAVCRFQHWCFPSVTCRRARRRSAHCTYEAPMLAAFVGCCHSGSSRAGWLPSLA